MGDDWTQGKVLDNVLDWISADMQTKGRGKGDRKWQCVKGKQVLITYAFKFPESCTQEFRQRNIVNVSHILALSACQVLEPLLNGIKLKWPNDIILNGKKMGGMLAEAKSSAKGFDGVIIGIGLNINQSPQELAGIDRPVWPATSMCIEAGKEFDVSAVRSNLTVAFHSNLISFFQIGFSDGIRSLLECRLILLNEKVRFNTQDHNEHVDLPSTVVGIFTGMGEKGELLLQDSVAGPSKKCFAGELVPLHPPTQRYNLLEDPNVVLAIAAACSFPLVFSQQANAKTAMKDVFEILGMMFFVALGGRCAIKLPFTPVPITGQTLAIQLCSLFGGSMRSTLAMTLFAAHELCTAETLQMKLGSPKGTKATRGYILGFIPAAFQYGLPALWPSDKVNVANVMLNSAKASSIIYLFGMAGLMYYTQKGPLFAFQKGVIPFLPGDALKSFLAFLILKQAFP